MFVEKMVKQILSFLRTILFAGLYFRYNYAFWPALPIVPKIFLHILRFSFFLQISRKTTSFTCFSKFRQNSREKLNINEKSSCQK